MSDSEKKRMAFGVPLIERVPRSEEEEKLLLAMRPRYWEHFLFAAVLRREMEALEPIWRDHEIGFVRPKGRSLTSEEAMTALTDALARVSATTSNVERVFAPAVVEAAFGAPGHPGDPERITHMARRLCDIYATLLAWAGDMRGTLVPPRLRRAFDIASHLVDTPCREIRDFVQHTVTTIDSIPALLQSATRAAPVTIDLKLTLTIDQQLIDAFSTELRRLRSEP